MPAFVDLQPGTRVKVSPPGDPFGPSFEATVRATLPSQLRLGLPRRDREVLEVEPGQMLTMFTLVHGRVFRFEANVRLVEVANDSFFIDTPREAERTERREFYRLTCRIVPKLVARLDEDEAIEAADSDRRDQPLQAVILDLSGGGLMLQTRVFVEAGTRLRLVFDLEGDPLDLDVAALVLSCEQPTSSARSYRLHCQFIGLDRADRERLIRYVFRQQAELRRRGVI